MSAIRDISLRIEAPRVGIAQSPHVGFGNLVGLDITTVQGVAQLNNILVKKSGTTVVAQINWFVRHPVTIGEIYALDNAGQVYKSTDSGATWATLTGETGGGHGNGMMIYKNYLFVARDTAVDVCGDGTATGITSGNWSNTWVGLTLTSDVLWHPMLVSVNDDTLYIGAGTNVSSVVQVAGKTFAPGDATTYTATAAALLNGLPFGYRIKCIEELGQNLMLGTWQGTNVYDIRVATIFPWDRGTASRFGQPIQLADHGIHAMKNVGNSLVVLAGINGTIFRCDGSTAIQIGQLPTDLSGGKYLEFYPGSICSYKNKVFFGVGQGGTTAIPDMGVYSLMQTGKGSILNFEHKISTLSDGSANPLKPSALLPVTRDTLLVAWRDNATYGIDLTNATSYYDGSNQYVAYFDSPLYVIGDLDFLTSYLKMEIRFAKKLATGEGFQVLWRSNLTDSFVAMTDPNGNALNFDFATLGAKISHIVNCDIPPSELLQIRVKFLGTSTTTPQFKSLRLENYFIRGSQPINQAL